MAVEVEADGSAHANSAHANSDDTPFVRNVRRYAESRIAVAALAVLVVIILIAVFAPLISPQNPYDLTEIDLREGRLVPGAAKMSKENKIGVVVAVRGLRSVSGPSLTAKPMDILYSIEITISIG